jgi:hypothetical protein
MGATLLLTRPYRLADAARPYQIVLDDEPGGQIRMNSSAEMPIAAGTHTLQIRLPKIVSRRPGRGSPTVTFDVGDGEAAEFACHPPAYPQASFRWIASLLGDPDRWIQLERAQ